MDAASTPSAPRFGWFAIIATMGAVALAAFWQLLGQRYSPETFIARPTLPDTIEFVWFGAALTAGVCGLVIALRRSDLWRDVARAALPTAASSLLVLVRTFARAPLQTYDMMFFCATVGWTTWLWLRTNHVAVSRLPVGVWSLVAILAAYQFWQQVRHLNSLALGYADCGENARLMFNTMTNPRELFLRVNPDIPLFYDHFQPGILPFMPLWLLWPDLKLTIALQIVSVFGAVVPLYFIGKRTFRDETLALLLVLAWLFYPSTSQFIYSSSYGFRWGNACLLFYFIALACWMNGRHGWAMAMAVWAMLIKEEAAIVVGMFGVYLALFERRRLVGIGLAAFAFGFFFLTTSVIVPAISRQQYWMTRFFYDLGLTKWEILLSPLTKPRIFWGRLLDPQSLYFTAALLAPLLFLPARKPSVLFIGSLTFVFCCLNPILKNISFHYQAGLLPAVFWALTRTVEHWPAPRRNNALLSVVVTCAVFSLFLGAQPWSKQTLPIRRSGERLPLVRQFGERIDPCGTLFATRRVAAHFVTQRYLYLDPPVPKETDFALLDLRDSWRGSTGNLDWLERLRRIQREVETIPGLHLAAAQDGLLLYSRREPPLDAPRLVERDALPARANRVDLDLGNGVHVVAFTITALPQRVRVTTFTTCSAPTKLDLAVRCVLHIGDEALASEFQPLGQGIWPIARWEANKFYADDFIVTLPAGLAREISSVSFDAVTLTP